MLDEGSAEPDHMTRRAAHALFFSALMLVPAFGASLISAPVATLSLAWLGLYLLFFR